MKIVLSVLLSACYLTGLAHAEIVIDDFDLGATVHNFSPAPTAAGVNALNDGIAGNRTVSVNPNLVAPAFNPDGTQFRDTAALLIESFSGLSTVTLDYVFTAPLDQTLGLPTLALRLPGGIAGAWTATFSINSNAQNSGPIALASGGVHWHTPVPVAVNDLSIVLARTSPGGGTISLAGAQVIANPEPASLALLGLTGVIGGVVVRRRRKAADVATAA